MTKIYHSSEHTPQQNDEGEATNTVEKLILESCKLQNDQPLASHANVVKLVVMVDHQEHTIDFVETKNHHANRIDDSHYEAFSTVIKKHDPGRYDPKNPWRNHHCTSRTERGGCHSKIACTFMGSIAIPSDDTTYYPKNSTWSGRDYSFLILRRDHILGVDAVPDEHVHHAPLGSLSRLKYHLGKLQWRYQENLEKYCSSYVGKQ